MPGSAIYGPARDWGIGLLRYERPCVTGQNFGHGGASGANLVIEPDWDLLIVNTHFRPGPDYKDYELGLFEACTAPFRRSAEKEDLADGGG